MLRCQTGAVGQRCLRHGQRCLGPQNLGAQPLGACLGLVGVGDRLVAQRKAVARFHQGLFSLLLLLAQQFQLPAGQHQCEIALRGVQHQALARSLPFQFGRFG